MKICFVFIVGMLGVCLVQIGCSNANTANNKSVTANRETASANVSSPANQIAAHNSNAPNNVPAEKEVRTEQEKQTNIPNSSRNFGRDAVVDVPKVRSKVGSSIVVPMRVTGLAGKDVISYEFDLKYDPGVIQPVDTGADLKGTVSSALSLVTNPAKPGVLRVVVYGAKSIDKDGVLLNLKFKAVGASGAVSPLSIERIMFNEGDPGANANAGQVTLF